MYRAPTVARSDKTAGIFARGVKETGRLTLNWSSVQVAVPAPAD